MDTCTLRSVGQDRECVCVSTSQSPQEGVGPDLDGAEVLEVQGTVKLSAARMQKNGRDNKLGGS